MNISILAAPEALSNPDVLHLVSYLNERGHSVVNLDLIKKQLAGKVQSTTTFESTLSAIQSSELIIAETSVPSTDVGFFISYALNRGKKVIVLYKHSLEYSIIGMTIHECYTGRYVTFQDIENRLTQFNL